MWHPKTVTISQNDVASFNTKLNEELNKIPYEIIDIKYSAVHNGSYTTIYTALIIYTENTSDY